MQFTVRGVFSTSLKFIQEKILFVAFDIRSGNGVN